MLYSLLYLGKESISFLLYHGLSFFQRCIDDSSNKNKANHLQDDRNDPGCRIGNEQNL